MKLTIQKCKFQNKGSKIKTVKKSFSKTAKHESNFLQNHHFPSFSSSSVAELQPPRHSLTLYTYSEESENFIFHDCSWFSWILFSRFLKKSLENLFYFFLNADDSLFFLTPPRAIRNCSWVFPFFSMILIAPKNWKPIKTP